MRVSRSLLLIILAILSLTPSLNAGFRAEQHAIAAARDIILEGSRIRVRGDVHANGTAVLIGQVTVEGMVEGGRVALTGESRAAGIGQGAPATAIPGLDLASVRSRATRVLTGDQHLRGVSFLPGTTYVAGSVTLEGIVIGVGLLAAEGEVRLSNLQLVGTPLGIIAARRLVIEASRVSFRGLLQSAGPVQVSGRDINLTGALIGSEVQIRGSDITITFDPSVFSSVTLPPVRGPVMSAPTIESPRNNAVIPDGSPAITVIGTAPPGATVRLTLVHRAAGLSSSVETRAEADGRFRAIIPVPAMGELILSAVAVSGAATSQASTITVTVRDVRTPGGD